MNPDLAKLWQQVLVANKAALAAGDKLTKDDIDEFLKEQSGGKFSAADITAPSWRNLGRSFMQGLMMNNADELAGGKADPATSVAMKAAGNAVIPGMGTMGAGAMDVIGKISAALGGSEDVKQEMRLKGDMFAEDHPVADVAAKMVGGVAPALIPGAAARGLPMLASMGRGAVVGAGAGAVSSFGEGDTIGAGLKNMPMGAGIGGALGMVLPALISLYKYAKDPALRAKAQLAEMLHSDGGVDLVKARNAQAAAAGVGDHVTVADLGDVQRAGADWAATTSDRARSMIERTAMGRQEGQTTRLLDKVNDFISQDLGMNPNGAAEGKALATSRKMWAKGKKGYGGLRENNPVLGETAFPRATPDALPPEVQSKINMLDKFKQQVTRSDGTVQAGPQRVIDAMQADIDAAVKAVSGKFAGMSPAEESFARLMDQPKVRTALAEAKDLTKIGVDRALEEADVPSFEKVFNIRSRVKAMASAAFAKPGGGDLGARLLEVQRQIEEHLADRAAGYMGVTREYAQRVGLERALQKGMEAWSKNDPQALAGIVKSLAPDELVLFRKGMASEMMDGLRETATNRDAAGQLINASIGKDAKLGVIFGDKAEDFMKNAWWEHQMSKLRGAATGSPTARREVAQGTNATAGILQAAATNYASSANMAQSAVSRMLARGAKRQVLGAQADALAGMLMTKGTSAIDQLLETMRTPPSTTGGMGSAVLPAFMGAQAGGATGQP
jgi:hypothetical protein